MTEKDEKDTSQENSPEAGDDLDSLSLDEKAAFEKIMAEIGEMNQDPSPGTDSEDKTDTGRSSSKPTAGEKNQSPDAAESGKGQDSSNDKQAIPDKIMSEIAAGESVESSEAEPAQDKAPTPDDGDEKLSDDQQAALDKIMAEINARESGREPEAELDQEKAPAADNDDQKLSDDQQAALDKIMAEINARESGREPEAEPDQEKAPAADSDDQKLSDDQQAALDKIMAEINARESGLVTETQSEENPPPTADQEEPKEKPNNDTKKLSLDEFNDELTNLLATAGQATNEQSKKKTVSNGMEVAPEPEAVKPVPAPERELPPMKFVPASQPSQAESDPVVPPAEAQTDPSEPAQEDYAILQEIDPTQIGKADSNNSPGRSRNWAARFGQFIKITAAAIAVAAIAGATYWGYDLFRHKRNLWHELTDRPTAVQSSSGSGRTEVSADPGSIPIVVRAATENPGGVPQQLSPTTFASLKSDLMAARKQIKSKIQEILDLKAHYQKGIQEEQLKIRAELRIRPARSLESAQANTQIDLSMRAIQRRMVYIAKLDTPLKLLEASSEDLLYMERRTQLFETLSQWIRGPSIPEYKQAVGSRIESHMKVTTELNVDDIQVDPPSMASIWSDVQTGVNKEKSNIAERSKRNAEDRHISAEICKGEYDRKYLLTSLSEETAQCLIRWSGKDLYLNGLTELSPQAAKILAQWPGEWLSLNGIEEISVETAKYLSQWPGKRLSLNGLGKLSPQATALLSRWQGEQLEMIGLTAIGRWENYATRLYLSETLRRKLQM